MRKYVQETKTFEFHNILEMMEGDDMEVYLNEQGRPYMIDRVKEIGGQIISGLLYLHNNKIIH